MIATTPNDQVETFPNMHEAGVVMQEKYVDARDLDRHGQHWVSTVIGDLDKSRTVYPKPVTMLVRSLGWMTLIEIGFADESSYRFIHSRDGFEDHKAYVRGVDHILRLTPDLKIKSTLEILRERRAAKA
jgi:hypothetical protein